MIGRRRSYRALGSASTPYRDGEYVYLTTSLAVDTGRARADNVARRGDDEDARGNRDRVVIYLRQVAQGNGSHANTS